MTVSAPITPTDASLLGALQGATEFLPISSSGHLRLAQDALSAHPPTILFDIALHVGTLVAVVIFFRRDVLNLIGGLETNGEGGWFRSRAARQIGLLVLASIPTAIMGLALQPLVTDEIATPVVGGLLLVNGLILLLTRRRRGPDEPLPDGEWGISPWVALAVGLAQGFGVLPGISRSGITIATAMLFGIHGRSAAIFSFLLSIPAILGAVVLASGDLQTYSSDALPSLGLGMLVALIVGLACLKFLMGTIQRARFHHFAWYCFALGAVAIIWGLTG